MTQMAETVQKPKPHITEEKEKLVKELEDILKKAKIIGIVNMEGLPGAQLASIKKSLRGKATLFMAKRRLMKIAIANVQKDIPNIENIIPLMKGMPALLFTEENPFSLYKLLKKSKSEAPAKEGLESPRDITIPEGPTPFAPGPVISELGNLGIKAGIVEGKVIVKADSLVIKEGEKFSALLASMLTRLGIKPMEIGLNVQAVFEDGVIYDKKVLDIDEEQFMSNLLTAAAEAMNLSVDTGYVTKDNRELLIITAFRNSKAVALEALFLAEGIKAEVVEKVARSANAVASEANFEVTMERSAPSAPEPEVKKEEPKVEEKKEAAETKVETPVETPTPVEEKPAEAPVEKKKEESKVEEKPKTEEKKEAVEEKKEPDTPKEKPREEVIPEAMPPSASESTTVQHPKDEAAQKRAADMLKELQQKGTLRD